MTDPAAARSRGHQPHDGSTPGLRRIAAGAATLFERLQRPVPGRGSSDLNLAQTRLERWCDTAAGGDWSAFERRLAWDGLEREQVAAVLGSPVEFVGPLPGWAETLGHVMSAARASAMAGSPVPDLTGTDGEALPFEELLHPFIEVARARLVLSGSAEGAQRAPPEAMRAFERNLLARVCQVLAQPLLERFTLMRPAGYRLLSRWVGESADAGSELYDRFVAEQLQDGLAGTLEYYPVAGRLAATVLDHWVSETAELLGRLADDRPDLERVFGIPGTARLVGARSGLSDPHRGGRTVKILHFEGGSVLVYKPRDVRPELGLSELVDWCGRRGAPGSLRAPRVLARDGFGWVEFVDHQPCPDDTCVADYYRRAGALIALARALRASDCHYENVVAHGAHPVLVDGEVVMRPKVPRPSLHDGATDADRFAASFAEESVLSTSILPNRVGGGVGGNTFEAGVLGATEEQLSWIPVPSWVGVGTDRIELKMERCPVPESLAAPRCRGEIVPVAGYEDDVVAGFRDMHGFLVQHRGELVSAQGPLRSLMDASVRYVFRATRVYGALQQRLLHPEHQRSGVVWSIELDALARPLVGEAEEPGSWPLVAEERAAMERLDIPTFAVPAASRDLPLESGRTLASFFAASGAQGTLAQIDSLDLADLEWQTTTIRAALLTASRAEGDRMPEQATPGRSPPSRTELFDEACLIGHRMEETLRRMPDGSVTWVGLQMSHETGRPEVAPLDRGLYGGTTGIALFASALHSLGGSRRFEALALDALRSVRALLGAEDAGPGGPGSDVMRAVGGVAGLGSLIYALTSVASFLGRDEIRVEAQRAVRLVTSEAIAADRALDVFGGSAGTILGLVALHEHSADPEALARAVECGHHLLRSRVATEDGGPRAWPTLGGEC